MSLVNVTLAAGLIAMAGFVPSAQITGMLTIPTSVNFFRRGVNSEVPVTITQTLSAQIAE